MFVGNAATISLTGPFVAALTMWLQKLTANTSLTVHQAVIIYAEYFSSTLVCVQVLGKIK